MSKTLPLNLAKHPLLIQAFTGEDGRFTTKKVWAKIKPWHTKSIEDVTPECVANFDASGYHPVVRRIIAPAQDLEDLLDLAAMALAGALRWLILPSDPSLRVSVKPIVRYTEAEEILDDVFHNIGYTSNSPRIERLGEALVAVLEERQ